MGQTGQHDQVLEEGTDPNLGCFCHFLVVLLDFCPPQFPLRQNGDKDSAHVLGKPWYWHRGNVQELAAPTTGVCTNSVLWAGAAREGFVGGTRKDSCIVSRPRQRTSPPG